MARYPTQIVTIDGTDGVPLEDVYVTIVNSQGNLASLTDDNGNALANPIVTGSLGVLEFNIPDPGDTLTLSYNYGGRIIRRDSVIVGVPPIYSGPPGGNVMSIGLFTAQSTIAVPAGTTRIRTSGYAVAGVGAADYVYDATINAANLGNYSGWAFLQTGGGGWRLANDQPLNLSHLGWKTDYVSPTQRGTDNAPVIARLKSLLSYYVDQRSSIYAYTPHISVPLGRAYTTASFNFDYGTVALTGVGQGTTDCDAQGGSVIVFAENTPGIIINAYNTDGYVSRPSGLGSTGSSISGIGVVSMGGTAGTQADGFRLRGQFTMFNCYAIGFPQHGFNKSADQSGQGGNTNASIMFNCAAARNYLDGFYGQGGDSNAASMYGLNARFNGRCGINMSQFLADTLCGYHSEGNGTNQSGPTTMPQQAGAQCYYAGYYWSVYPGKAAQAANSTPGVDSTIWVRGAAASGPFSTYPTYAAGTAYTEGSAIRLIGANAQNVVVGGYDEPGQPPAFVGGGGMILGGQHDAGVIGMSYMSVSAGLLNAFGWQAFDGTRTVTIGNGRYEKWQSAGFFPWFWDSDGNGGLILNGGDDGGNAITIGRDRTFTLPKQVIPAIRTTSAVAPATLKTTPNKMIPVYDSTSTLLGYFPIYLLQ